MAEIKTELEYKEFKVFLDMFTKTPLNILQSISVILESINSLSQIFWSQ